MSEAYDVFKCVAYVHDATNGMKCVKPSACLVNRFAYKISRVSVRFFEPTEPPRLTGANPLGVEWIVILGQRHRAGVKPHIKHFRNATIFASGFIRKYDFVNIGTVKIRLKSTVARKRYKRILPNLAH